MHFVNIVVVQNINHILKQQHVPHVKWTITAHQTYVYCWRTLQRTKEYKAYQSDDCFLGFHEIKYEVKHNDGNV